MGRMGRTGRGTAWVDMYAATQCETCCTGGLIRLARSCGDQGALNHPETSSVLACSQSLMCDAQCKGSK